ncbi:MAG TPA: hydroxymethylbilane synthase [Solirubrobacteraceae bacterium]|jgi:hydroxymethylbilane synthase
MRIGTRGSALARVQAEWVAGLLGPESEIVEITTLGDRGAAMLDKSRWVSALETALLEDRIDIAVHSAKDVPTELPEGLELIAIPRRADPRDAICGAKTLADLPSGARVGTSSLRRAAQIGAVRDDLELVEVRGNVDTRLRKLAEGQVDALVLALAGLQRLGREHEAGGTLDEFVPAAGQGALALEARTRAVDADRLAGVTDRQSMECVGAERALVRALGASCNTPVGAYGRPVDGDQVELAAWVGLPDGSAWLRDRVCDEAQVAGEICAQRLLAAGARELLAEAERVPAR